MEVSAPSRVSENEEGKGGAWSSGALSFRLWIDEVAEAEAECDGDGDCELRDRSGAVKCDECVSISLQNSNSRDYRYDC